VTVILIPNSSTFERMSTQWQYSIEQFGGADHTYKDTAGKGGLQLLLNDKAKEGWELVEQQAAFDGNGRLYIFRQEIST
jgi:hypothetical protein